MIWTNFKGLSVDPSVFTADRILEDLHVTAGLGKVAGGAVQRRSLVAFHEQDPTILARQAFQKAKDNH